MDYEKKIEIPFGAFDSELIRQEISIPNGFNAVIDGNKIILTRAESADEKIRKEIMDFIDINTIGSDERRNRWFSYLEKQGESYTKRDVDDAWLKGMCDAKRELEKQGEQKPIEWDEYDEMYVSALIAIVEKDGATGKNLRDTLTGWLRCLKGRFKRNG